MLKVLLLLLVDLSEQHKNGYLRDSGELSEMLSLLDGHKTSEIKGCWANT